MVEECTGCLGCIDICKVGALDVETMEDGFIYPKIDKDKCVECGKCISVCSFKNPIKKLYPQDTYIAQMLLIQLIVHLVVYFGNLLMQ